MCVCVHVFLKNICKKNVSGGVFLFLLSFLAPRFTCAKQGKGRNRGIVGTVAKATTEGSTGGHSIQVPAGRESNLLSHQP